jgi:hypothetical protein
MTVVQSVRTTAVGPVRIAVMDPLPLSVVKPVGIPFVNRIGMLVGESVRAFIIKLVLVCLGLSRLTPALILVVIPGYPRTRFEGRARLHAGVRPRVRLRRQT